MAYLHCMPGTIEKLDHRLDNVVEGVVFTPVGDIAFITRGHIIKAVNRNYRRSSWKPRVGDAVLMDGDLAKGRILIDHIEPAAVPEDAPITAHPHLDAIAAAINAGVVSKDVRFHRHGDLATVRLAGAASRTGARGEIEEELIHGYVDLSTNAWRMAARRRSDGTVTSTRIDAAIMIVLARAAGRDLLVGETVAETDTREQALARANRQVGLYRPGSRSTARISAPPPSDDCPF